MQKINKRIFKVILLVVVCFSSILFFVDICMAAPMTTTVDQQKSEVWLDTNSKALRFGLLSELRLVRNENQEIEYSPISGLEIGFSKGDFVFSIEGNTSSVMTSGEGQIAVSSRRQEVYFWSRWTAIQMNYFSIYGALGVGGVSTKVESLIVNEYSKDESGIEGIGGGAVGLQANLFSKYLAMQVEGRGLVARSYDPSPTGSILVKLVFIGPFFE